MIEQVQTYIQRLLVCLLIVSAGSWWTSCSTAPDANEKEYRVLILQSYRSDCLWAEDLNRGVADCFEKNKMAVALETFYLNSEGLSQERMISLLNTHLNEIHRPDLILVSADHALLTQIGTKHPFSFEVPVVFSGINFYTPEWLVGHTNITGFTSSADYASCFSLIKSLYPNTHTVYIDVDDSYISTLAVADFKNQVKNITDTLHYEITNMDTSEGARFLWDSTELSNSVRIMPVWNSFYFGYARNTNVPFFAVNSKGFGYAYLGGYMTPSYDQTFSAANIGVQLLKGNVISDFPIRKSPQVPVFDWIQMQKYHLTDAQLPVGSVIVNRSLMERYMNHILVFVVLFLILFLGVSIILSILSRDARAAKKKTQEELLEHRNKLKTVMSSIREGVISIDREMNIFAINSAARDWLNMNGREQNYIGKNILQFVEIIDEELEDMGGLIQRVFYKGKIIHFSENCKIKSLLFGNQFAASGSISPIYQNGYLYGAVIVFADETEEYTRKKFLELTLEAGGYASWRVDHRTRNFVVDQSFVRTHQIQNYGEDGILIDVFQQMIHPDDVPKWIEVNRLLMQGIVDSYVLEFRVNLDGTRYQWVEIRYTSLPSLKPGEISLIFGICSNIDKSMQTLQALEQARDKAQMSDRLKSAFLANMSHEIRTPLNAIVGFSNVLTSGEDFEQEERQLFVSTIRSNCNLLLGLISDVLDMAQIESGSMHYKDEVCDVNEFVEQIIVTQRVIIPDRIQLIGKVPDETSYIMTDKLRLNQVITNLINNAVKFTEKGSVTIGYTREAGVYHFYVEDTGRGIPEKDIDNIFKRFFKKDDFVQGAGLGLSICKMIVDHYNGTIHVTSTVGKGSRFDISIPFTNVDVDKCDDKREMKKLNFNPYKLFDMNTTNDSQLSQDRVTLLIAEDEESNYLLLKTVLQKHCNLIRARTGREALDLYIENAPAISLIMLDIKMPEMTGIEALREIRKLTKEIPIIMQSAYVFDTDMESARQAGASDFITKPINLKTLKTTISKFCPSVQW